MCGIAGFNWKNEQVIRKMTNAMAHRGPDSNDILVEERVSLGHLRLAILDLSENGKQPMFFEDYIITFNGEIYNYLEIRQQLQKQGHQFRTGTDTEVLLHAYKVWGKDCLQHLNGMFAFCIYDQKREQLFLARDRIGQKPIYYYHQEDKFIFASEIKGILANVGIGLQIDETAVYDYFTYGYIPAPKSIYQAIHKLEAGHTMVYDLKSHQLKLERYWTPTIAQQIQTYEKSKSNIFDLLQNATQIRLRSDVPVGLFISAGLDSTTLAYLLKDSNVSCFNVDMKDGESEKTATLCREWGLPYQRSEIGELDYHADFARIMQYFDEPFADNSSIPTYLINKAAKENNYKVLLSGDGGDELLVGYKRYKQLELFEKNPVKPLFSLLSKGVSLVNAGSDTAKALYFLAQKDVRDFYIKLRGGFTREEKKKIFCKSFWQKFEGYNEYWVFDKYWRKEEDMPLVKKAQIFDIFSYLPDDILVKADRMSMANSIELRSPFLDYRLFEEILRLDLNSYYNGNLKGLTKDWMKGKLPNYILENKKKGFGYNVNEVIGETYSSFVDKQGIDFLLNHKKIFYSNALFLTY